MIEAILQDIKKVIPEPVWNILMLLFGIAAAAWGIIRSFVFVQPGFRGIRKRFGKPILIYPKKEIVNGALQVVPPTEIARRKAVDRQQIAEFKPAIHGRPKYLEPGFNMLVPIMHNIEMVNVQQNIISFGEQRVTIDSEYIAYDLPSMAGLLEMKDPYLWMLVSRDAEAQIKAACDTHLTTIIHRHGVEKVLQNDPIIMTELVNEIQAVCAELGVVMTALYLGTRVMNVEASWDAQSRREVAHAIQSAGSITIPGTVVSDE